MATAKGPRIGRPSVVDPHKLAHAAHLREAGDTIAEIVAKTGITRSSLYRHLSPRPVDPVAAAGTTPIPAMTQPAARPGELAALDDGRPHCAGAASPSSSAAPQIRRWPAGPTTDLVLASTTEVGQFLTRSGVDRAGCRSEGSHAGRHTRLRPVRPRVRGPAGGADLDRQRLFCTRGTAEWEDAGTVHYPGTYAHGGFNRETTILGGRPVLDEDLVNLPNWLVLKRGVHRVIEYHGPGCAASPRWTGT